MALNPQDRINVIKYRIERAYSTLKEAKFAQENEFWNLTANRLYYSAFYICQALLLFYQIPVNSHAGLNRMMGYHFIRTGILSDEEGKLLSMLFNMRQTGDYNDLFDWSKEDVEPLFEPTENLINKINSLLSIE